MYVSIEAIVHPGEARYINESCMSSSTQRNLIIQEIPIQIISFLHIHNIMHIHNDSSHVCFLFKSFLLISSRSS